MWDCYRIRAPLTGLASLCHAARMSKLKTILITAAIAFPIGLAAGPLAHHPNLEAATSLLDQAWDKVTKAQAANEFDMGGHAQKAKDAIGTAREEIKLAAAAAGK